MSDPLLGFGTNHCKCAKCGEYFSTVANFDLHRKDGACLNPAKIVAQKGARKGEPKLQKNAKGMWVGVGSPIYAEAV